MTTLAPSALSDRPSPGDESRHVAVFANLLPDEVVNARQTGHSRRIVVFALVGLLAVLGIGLGISKMQTSMARSDLNKAQAEAVDLTNQENSFAPLVKAQTDTATLNSELATVMAGDLQWTTLTTAIRAAAPAGVTVAGITASLQTSSAGSITSSGTGITALRPDATNLIGSVTISGTATSTTEIAAYLDALNKVHGLTLPWNPGSNSAANALSFTATAEITTDALGGRYSSKKGS